MREFTTGATRDKEEGKYDYEGFLSPLVLERFGEYMHKHRKQTDGNLRDSDNWQKGIPISAYRKSLVRHLIQVWGVWRGHDVRDDRGEKVDLEDALLAIMFNVQGYLLEHLKEKAAKQQPESPSA